MPITMSVAVVTAIGPASLWAVAVLGARPARAVLPGEEGS